MDFRTESKTPKQRNFFIIMFWVFVPKNTHTYCELTGNTGFGFPSPRLNCISKPLIFLSLIYVTPVSSYIAQLPSIKENLAFFQTLAYCIYFFMSMAISCACLSCRSEAKAAHSCACHHQLARDSSRTVWTLGAVDPRELFIRLGAFRPRDPFAYLYFKNIKNAVKCYYLYYVSPLIKLV